MNRESYELDCNDIPDQSGRVVVVRGANGGPALEASRELTGQATHVVTGVQGVSHR